MRKTPYAISAIIKVVVLGALGSVASISSAEVLNLTSATNTSPWRALMSGSVYYQDSGGKTGNNTGIDDQQTGQGVSDIVGDASNVAAGYVGYGTMGTDTTTQYIAFRVRLNVVSTNLNTLNQVTYALIDVNRDGNVDFAVGGEYISTPIVTIVDATGQSGNTGPSNTTLLLGTNNPALNTYTATSTGATANLTYVTATEATTISGTADALISFAVPFTDFVAAVQNANVLTSGYSFDANSSFNVVIATSNNVNNINQDTMASMAAGVSFKFADTITVNGTSPVPEPSTVVIFGALMAPIFIGVVRRQLRERAKAKQAA
jgi:hypothetical protein